MKMRMRKWTSKRRRLIWCKQVTMFLNVNAGSTSQIISLSSRFYMWKFIRLLFHRKGGNEEMRKCLRNYNYCNNTCENFTTQHSKDSRMKAFNFHQSLFCFYHSYEVVFSLRFRENFFTNILTMQKSFHHQHLWIFFFYILFEFV